VDQVSSISAISPTRIIEKPDPLAGSDTAELLDHTPQHHSPHPDSPPDDLAVPGDRHASASVHAARQSIGSTLEEPPQEPFISTTLTTNNHTYTTVAKLGSGGMGDVYLATDENNNPVAIKTPKINLNASAKAIRSQVTRLKREIENMKLMTGKPGLIPLLDHKFDPAKPNDTVIVMPVYPEGSLLSKLRSGNKPHLMSIIYMAKKVAKALSELHNYDIVHRDIKLANILLEPAKKPESAYDLFDVVLCDYGLSKEMSDAENPSLKTVATDTNQIVGTVEHMSPEQASADKFLGESADIYGLATVIYVALSGKSVVQSTNTARILTTLLNLENATQTGLYIPLKAANPIIPNELTELVDNILTTTDPEDRLIKAGISGTSSAANALAYKLDQIILGIVDSDFQFDLVNLSENVTPVNPNSRLPVAA
jgi:serine/threonine protein kinase